MILYVFLVVLAVVLAILFLLFRKPADGDGVYYHRFSPKYYAMNKLDALSVRFLGKPAFHPCTAEQLMFEARAQVEKNIGFGPSKHWEKPFRMLVKLLNTSPSLSVKGRERLRGDLLHSLKVRLRSEMFFADNVDAMDEMAIRHKMVFVVGLPRSGATLVHNLMAYDHDAASFTFADYLDPSQLSSERAEDSDSKVKALKRIMPQLSRKHNLDATKREDDYMLWKHSFVNPLLALALRNCEEYRDWLYDPKTDMVPFYEDLERFWKMLLIKKKYESFDRVLVKSPFHAAHFASLLKVFPEARFIMMLRSPKIALSSFCSVLRTVNAYYEVAVVPHHIGQVATDLRLVRQLQEHRHQVPPNHWCDQKFKWLLVDAISQIKNIFKFFDWKYEPSNGRMDYMRKNPAEICGKHIYDIREYGVSPERLEAIWADFDVASAVSTPQKTPLSTPTMRTLAEEHDKVDRHEAIDAVKEGANLT